LAQVYLDGVGWIDDGSGDSGYQDTTPASQSPYAYNQTYNQPQQQQSPYQWNQVYNPPAPTASDFYSLESQAQPPAYQPTDPFKIPTVSDFYQQESQTYQPSIPKANPWDFSQGYYNPTPPPQDLGQWDQSNYAFGQQQSQPDPFQSDGSVSSFYGQESGTPTYQYGYNGSSLYQPDRAYYAQQPDTTGSGASFGGPDFSQVFDQAAQMGNIAASNKASVADFFQTESQPYVPPALQPGMVQIIDKNGNVVSVPAASREAQAQPGSIGSVVNFVDDRVGRNYDPTFTSTGTGLPDTTNGFDRLGQAADAARQGVTAAMQVPFMLAAGPRDWLAESDIPVLNTAAGAVRNAFGQVINPALQLPNAIAGAMSDGGDVMDLLHGAGPAGWLLGGAADVIQGRDPAAYYQNLYNRLPQTQLIQAATDEGKRKQFEALRQQAAQQAFDQAIGEGKTPEEASKIANRTWTQMANPVNLAEYQPLQDFGKLPSWVQLPFMFSNTLNPGNKGFDYLFKPLIGGGLKGAGRAGEAAGIPELGKKLESPQQINANQVRENVKVNNVLDAAQDALGGTEAEARAAVFEQPSSPFFWNKQGIKPETAAAAQELLQAARQVGEDTVLRPGEKQQPTQSEFGQDMQDTGQRPATPAPDTTTAPRENFDEFAAKAEPAPEATPAKPAKAAKAAEATQADKDFSEFGKDLADKKAAQEPVKITPEMRAIGIPAATATHGEFLDALQKNIGVKSKAYRLVGEGVGKTEAERALKKAEVVETKPLEQFRVVGPVLNGLSKLTLPYMSRASLNTPGRAIFRDPAGNGVKFFAEGFNPSRTVRRQYERLAGTKETLPMGPASMTGDAGTSGRSKNWLVNAGFFLVQMPGEVGSFAMRKATKGKIQDLNQWAEYQEGGIKNQVYKDWFNQVAREGIDQEFATANLPEGIAKYFSPEEVAAKVRLLSKEGTLTADAIRDWVKGRMMEGASLTDYLTDTYNPAHLSDTLRKDPQIAAILDGKGGPLGEVLKGGIETIPARVDEINAANKAKYEAAVAKISTKKTTDPKVVAERTKTLAAVYQQTRPVKVSDVVPGHPIWEQMKKDVKDSLTLATKTAEKVDAAKPGVNKAAREQTRNVLVWAAKDGKLKNLKRGLAREVDRREAGYKQYEKHSEITPHLENIAALKSEVLQYGKLPNRSYTANRVLQTIDGKGVPGDVVVRYTKEGATHFRTTQPWALRPGETVVWSRENTPAAPAAAPVQVKKATPETYAYGSDPNKVYNFTHKVVSLDDLIASNLDTGAVNPKYTAELQPRDRTRIASTRQVDTLAKNLVPEHLLTDFKQLEKGAPIVGADRMVESGNGRTLALRKARSDNPEKWADYQAKLKEALPEYGLNESALKGIKDPVLIRERTSDVPDRAEFAREANNPVTMGMSPLETAAQDSRLLSQEKLLAFKIGEDQTIDEALTSAANREFVRSFVGELPANEHARLLTKYGTLNQDGLRRIKAAMFTRIFPGKAGQRLAETFMEAIDGRTKNFETAVSAVMPKLTRMQGLIDAGQRAKSLDITADIAAAVDAQARLRGQGMKVSDYLGQSSMFGDELTPLQKNLLAYFDTIGNKPKAIKDFLNGYADAVEAAPDPHQMGLFGAVEQPTKEAIIERLTGQKAPATEPAAGANPFAGWFPETTETGQATPLAAAGEKGVTAPPQSDMELAGGPTGGLTPAARRTPVSIDAFPRKPQAREAGGKFEHFYPITSKGKATDFELVSIKTASDEAPVNDRVWRIINTTTGEVLPGKFKPDGNAITAIKDAIRGPQPEQPSKPTQPAQTAQTTRLATPEEKAAVAQPNPAAGTPFESWFKPPEEAAQPPTTEQPFYNMGVGNGKAGNGRVNLKDAAARAEWDAQHASPDLNRIPAQSEINPQDLYAQVNNPFVRRIAVDVADDGTPLYGNVLTPDQARKMLARWNKAGAATPTANVVNGPLSVAQRTQYFRDFLATDEFYRQASGNTFKLDLDTFSPVRISDGVSLDELMGLSRPTTIGEPRPVWPTDFPTDMDGALKAVEKAMGAEAYKTFAEMKRAGDQAGIDMAYSDIARAMGFPDPTEPRVSSQKVSAEVQQAAAIFKRIEDDARQRKATAGAEVEKKLDALDEADKLAQDILATRTKVINQAHEAAYQRSTGVYFDYTQKNVVDQALGSLLPFNFWARKNFVYLAKYFAVHPAQFVAVLNFYKELEDENKNKNGLGQYLLGNILLWQNPDGSKVVLNFGSILPFVPLGDSDSFIKIVNAGDDDQAVNTTPLGVIFGSDRKNSKGEITGRDKGIAGTYFRPNPIIDAILKTGKPNEGLKALGWVTDGFGSPDPSENRMITQILSVIPDRLFIRDIAAYTGATKLLRSWGVPITDLDLEGPLNSFVYGPNSGKPVTRVIQQLAKMAQDDPKNQDKYLEAVAKLKEGNWLPVALDALDKVDAETAQARLLSQVGMPVVIANTPPEQFANQIYQGYGQVKGKTGSYQPTTDPATGKTTNTYQPGESEKFFDKNAGAGVLFSGNKTPEEIEQGRSNDQTRATRDSLYQMLDAGTLSRHDFNLKLDELKQSNPIFFQAEWGKNLGQSLGITPTKEGEKQYSLGELFDQVNPLKQAQDRKYFDTLDQYQQIGGDKFDKLTAQAYKARDNGDDYTYRKITNSPEYQKAQDQRDEFLTQNPEFYKQYADYQRRQGGSQNSGPLPPTGMPRLIPGPSRTLEEIQTGQTTRKYQAIGGLEFDDMQAKAYALKDKGDEAGFSKIVSSPEYQAAQKKRNDFIIDNPDWYAKYSQGLTDKNAARSSQATLTGGSAPQIIPGGSIKAPKTIPDIQYAQQLSEYYSKGGADYDAQQAKIKQYFDANQDSKAYEIINSRDYKRVQNTLDQFKIDNPEFAKRYDQEYTAKYGKAPKSEADKIYDEQRAAYYKIGGAWFDQQQKKAQDLFDAGKDSEAYDLQNNINYQRVVSNRQQYMLDNPDFEKRYNQDYETKYGKAPKSLDDQVYSQQKSAYYAIGKGSNYDQLKEMVSNYFDQKNSKAAYAISDTKEYQDAKAARAQYLKDHPDFKAKFDAENEAKYGPAKTSTSSSTATSNSSSNRATYANPGSGRSAGTYTPKKATASYAKSTTYKQPAKNYNTQNRSTNTNTKNKTVTSPAGYVNPFKLPATDPRNPFFVPGKTAAAPASRTSFNGTAYPARSGTPAPSAASGGNSEWDANQKRAYAQQIGKGKSKAYAAKVANNYYGKKPWENQS
jgi:hypothetical protein